ncbi:hypothetical protein CBS101457_004111 [Exobasidium rhododendri]|nr:hypothetical protein CBS101457_004111 [Exobasidium rhododendri]
MTFAIASVAMLLSSLPLSNAVATPGGFEVVQQDSLASAMMMALIDENNVMIIDKAENNGVAPHNAVLSNGKPIWASVMSLTDYTMKGLDMTTNPFCASGAVLGNGSWLVAGGNQGVGNGGNATGTGTVASGPYMDSDGRLAIRLMQPEASSSSLSWIDNAGTMTSARWYPGIEVMTDGSVLLIGGATGGGYINRNYPNTDPAFEGGTLANLAGGGANPTWEFWPPKGNAPAVNNFMVLTSGLNMYPHTYLMPSGKLFMQANYSTTLWDMYANDEDVAYTDLDDMPNQITRVYPASGATAMLPLTPENNYTPTILFCGGSIMTDAQWGSYGTPNTNTYNIAAQTDCSSITPEDANGNLLSPHYTQEEDLPQGRSMGQFIHLPTGQMVIVNGAQRGTAGYGNTTWNMVNGVNLEGFSQDPTYQPVLYDPSLPIGSRLTSTGFGTSTIARLYHSSAILLPDGSVLIGGSNPHQDVSLSMPLNTTPQGFNTTYELEKWYPMYYNEPRPSPAGLPSYILYGGNTWNFSMDAAFMGTAANYNAENTKVMVIRPGFSTHAMNMGQRSLQLQHTYTVNSDGSVEYMVNPMPINQNIFVSGPALLFITIAGVPSVGKLVQIGVEASGGSVPNIIVAGAAPSALPVAVTNANFNVNPSKSGVEAFGIGKLVGIAVGGAAAIALIILAFCCWRRRSKQRGEKGTVRPSAGAGGAIYGMGGYTSGGPEYKRVNTPTGGASFQGFALPHRSSTGTFDTYKMHDVSGPQTPYYDRPNTPGTPRAMARSQLGEGHDQSYASQGWGEHQSQGDVGEQYYHDSAYSDPSRYYDSPNMQLPLSPYQEPASSNSQHRGGSI